MRGWRVRCKELDDILCEHLRFLQRGKVATTLEPSPAHNVVRTLAPAKPTHACPNAQFS